MVIELSVKDGTVELMRLFGIDKMRDLCASYGVKFSYKDDSSLEISGNTENVILIVQYLLGILQSKSLSSSLENTNNTAAYSIKSLAREAEKYAADIMFRLQRLKTVGPDMPRFLVPREEADWIIGQVTELLKLAVKMARIAERSI